MNKLTHNLAFKIMSIFLFVITVIIFIGGVIGTCLLSEYGFFETSVDNVKIEIFENITHRYANYVFYNYFLPSKNISHQKNTHDEKFYIRSTNFFFTLKNSEGETVLSNYSGQEFQLSRTYRFSDTEYIYDINGNFIKTKNETYIMDCFVKKNLDTNDFYYTFEQLMGFAFKMRYAVIIITIISFIVSTVIFIYLLCSAGRRRGEDKVVPNGIDKIPFDLLILIILLIFFAEAPILYRTDNIGVFGLILIGCSFAIIDILLVLLICMSFATRYKMGGWWKNTIVFRIIKFIIRILRKIANAVRYFYQHLSLVKKTIAVLFCIVVLEFLGLYISFNEGDVLLLFWFIEKIILIPVIILISINLQKLKQGGQKIAVGDLNYQIDTRHMFWEFKNHGENLNRISEGMSNAVEERLKSERFKTELITNVSHDIKTPLTSIINYVDLIKKENIENEKLKEYIDVLDRQSSRLKKLTEDLVEASKASTGSLAVNMIPTEVGVLFTQAVGEYEERIENTGLELILEKPEEDIFILADGRLLWRVFDNLLSNVCKYAQPATRIYLNLEKRNGQAVITFRNISKYALNITSDELLERFVRGDRSRNTEGSGLGLSIAKSLTELQKGKLDLYIDGDLFKVILKFDII